MAARVRITEECDGLAIPHTDGPRLYRFGSGSELPLLRADDREFYKVAYDGRPVFVAKSCCLHIEDATVTDALFVPHTFAVRLEGVEEAARGAQLLPHTFAELKDWVRSSRPPAMLAAVAAGLGTIAWLAGGMMAALLGDTDDALAKGIVFAVLIGYPFACLAAAGAAVVVERRRRLAAALLFPAAAVLSFPILVPGLVAATAAVLALTPTPPGGSDTPSEGWQRRDVVRAMWIGMAGVAALAVLVFLLYVFILLSGSGSGE